jgi:ferrochelatase
MLSDPAILAMPGFVRLPLAAFIAARRAGKVRSQYREIGGGSPIGPITDRQARAVAAFLEREKGPMPVLVGMRYTEPSIANALAESVRKGLSRLVVMPLHPQWSDTTTGSAFREVHRVINGMRNAPEMSFIADFAEDPDYVAAVAGTVEEALGTVPTDLMPRTRVLFSAHGLPVRYVERGDPYPSRIEATTRAVMTRLGERNISHEICYQSRVGPVRWLEPSTETAIERAASDGIRAIVMVPVAFASDHLETLHEIDRIYRDMARNAGIPVFARAPSLNDRPDFTSALARIVLRAL